MKGQELEDFIDTLPDIAVYTHVRETVGQECYAISGGPNSEYEILLDTGEVVKGAARVVFKDQVETHIGLGYTYLGIGLLHKKI